MHLIVYFNFFKVVFVLKMSDTDADNAIAEGMESALAEAVRKFPVLYNKTHKHRFQSVYPEQHAEAWSKISDELNLEIESCKSLWSCMKQKFIKHRKKLDKCETVAAWQTYSELEKWLNQHVKKRRTRQDFIKQMKTGQRRIKKSESNTDCNDDDDCDGGEEEWTDLMEDKDTMVKIQLKRKDFKESNSSSTDNKKKFKIEVFNEQGSEVFNEFAEVETNAKGDVLNNCDKSNTETGQIEVIEVREPQLECKNIMSRELSATLDANMIKLEQVVLKCVHLAERSIIENSHTDSNESFGKYIASLVRELPVDKRVRAQFNILQYATELIRKESIK